MIDRNHNNPIERLESIWKPGPASEFFRSPKEWEADPRASVYGHQLRRAWNPNEGLGLWAVLCVNGKPAVYFKVVDRKEPESEREWQRLLWNQGAATMLVVHDPQEVRVYSGLARPEQQPPSGDDDKRLVAVFDRVANILEIQNFIRSVETGQFYRDHAAKFRTDRAVDRYLLDNLGEARDQLCDSDEEFALPAATAHRFLGRCLFTSYLLERGIIGATQLRRAGAKGKAANSTTLKDLLEQLPATDATDVLYGLFRVLKDDFNGSMFSSRLSAEKQYIRKRHIGVLHKFLRGDEMKTGQSVLFPLYDFHFIPIEFISAIYEDFLAAEDDSLTQPSPDSGRKNKSKRRKVGAYYTPPRLAEVVVDVATQGWDTVLGKRCLDPACGSGIFLVILFQRMAEEWRKRNPKATNTKRARALRELLTKNLCGVDVNETACMVASFSLYLSFMDQFDDPRDIWALADELKKSGSEKVLPLLMASDDDANNDERSIPSIHTANFFGKNLPKFERFDLVIGNPPWIGRYQAGDGTLEQWILHEPIDNDWGNPFIRELPKGSKGEARLRSRFLPNRQSANAFMWKAPMHLKPNGRACLLLPSKVLLANQVDEFQKAWFRRFTVDAVWQLSDYRHILFEGAICPAAIIKFTGESSSANHVSIPYIVPKVDRTSPRTADLDIISEDRKSIPLTELIQAANHGNAATVWKKHFWGTGRDQELIDRLMQMPRLADIAGRPGKSRWSKGVGFQPYHEGKTKGGWERAWWDEKHSYVDPHNEGGNIVLLKDDCVEIGKRFRRLRRSPDPRIFSAPLVIFSRARNRIAFADFPVLFQDTTRSISGPKQDRDLLLFLTAVLNSPLAHYFLFHTSANWGIERDTVLLDEYLHIPFPLPSQTRSPQISRTIITNVAKQLRQLKAQLESRQSSLFLGFKERRRALTETTRSQISELVNDYYGLSKWERILVAEMATVFEPSSTPASRESQIPTLRRTETDDHRAYAELLCSTLNGWLRRNPWKIEASAQIARKPGLGLLTLTRTSEPGRFIEIAAGNEFETVLPRIQEASIQKQKGIDYARGFVFFELDKLHVLKPLILRHWTKTAALNDADALMGFMATNGGTP